MRKIREAVRSISRSEGLAHIENYYRSGLRPSEYYKQHGLTEYQFYGWRKRYLCGVVRRDMGRDPLSGEVFIFMNRQRTTIKLLHWERGGLVVYHKRLESGRFTLPVFDTQTRSYHLRWTDLVLMVEGISLERVYYGKRYERGAKIV